MCTFRVWEIETLSACMSPAGFGEIVDDISKSKMSSLPLISCHSSELPPLGSSFYLIIISAYFQQTRISQQRREDQKGQREVVYYKS